MNWVNKKKKKKWGRLNFKIVEIISNDKKSSLSKHKRPVALKEAILSPLLQFHLTHKPPKPPPNAIRLIKRSKRNTHLNLISKQGLKFLLYIWFYHAGMAHIYCMESCSKFYKKRAKTRVTNLPFVQSVVTPCPRQLESNNFLLATIGNWNHKLVNPYIWPLSQIKMKIKENASICQMNI